jgi:hypothetical protein
VQSINKNGTITAGYDFTTPYIEKPLGKQLILWIDLHKIHYQVGREMDGHKMPVIPPKQGVLIFEKSIATLCIRFERL